MEKTLTAILWIVSLGMETFWAIGASSVATHLSAQVHLFAKYTTITSSRSQARWDRNMWALSLRSDFSPRVPAPYGGVKCLSD